MPKKQRVLPNLKIGPFAEAEERLEMFSSNLYVAHLYEQTVTELVEAEKELNDAIDIDMYSKEEIKVLKERVIFLETIVSLATKNFEGPQIEDANQLDH